MHRPVALAVALLALANSASAQESVETSVQHRFSAGVSTGVTRLGEATGRSLDLALAIAVGPAAALRFELGDTELDDLAERRDRRGSASLVFDLIRPLALWSAIRATPFVEGGLGVTRTLRFDMATWRPHLQGGAGLRIDLGSRLELSARVQHGVQRTPGDVLRADATIEPAIVRGERERYTRWQLGGSLRF